MGMKELVDDIKVSTYLAPASTTTWTASMAAVVNVDTAGFESNMFIVSTGELGSTDVAIQVWEADAAGAEGASGAAVCKPEDVRFAAEGNVAANLAEYVKVTATSQTLTLAAADCDGKAFMLAYIGSKRYIRLHITGSVAGIAGILVLQSHGYRMPVHTTE